MNNVQSYPVSKIQEQFWILNMMAPKSAAYNIPLVFQVNKNKIDIDCLEQAINTIVQRHEILRSAFEFIDGMLKQVVKNTGVFIDITVKDISDASENRVFPSEIQEEVDLPFSLDTAPLIRVSVFHCSNTSFLVIVFHHIVVDLHSKKIFEEELSKVYTSLMNHQQLQLEPLHQQYQDYTRWVNEWIQKEEAQKQIRAWKGELPDADNVLQLPHDFDRPKMNQLQGKRKCFELPPDLSDQIAAFSNEHQIAPFVFLLSCYAVFLNKLSGQRHIIIGVPLSNRKQEAFKNTFGVFVNSLPISIEITEKDTFEQVLGQVRKKLLLAHRKQEIPFVSIVESMNIRRNPAHNIFYQTGFTFEPQMDLHMDGQLLKSIPIERSGSQMDMYLTFWYDEGIFKAFWEYSTHLFSEPTIERFIEFFQDVCRKNCNAATIPLPNLFLESPLDKEIKNRFNNTLCDLPKKTTFELFDQQARLKPDKIAIICGNRQISYQELLNKTGRLSGYLSHLKINKNDVIGICMDRSIDMVICMLATMKLGATYLPLDPDFPVDRIKFMLTDANARLILTQDHLKQRFEEGDIPVIVYNPDDKESSQIYDVPEFPEIDMDSNAYILYTSGSTGKPKGLKIHHRALTNFLLSMAKTPGFCSEDVLLSTTTISFDISILELFLPLISGGRIVLAQSKEVLDGKYLMQLINEHQVNYFQATPGRWNILLKSGWEGKKDLKALVGGEALPSSLIDQLLPRVAELWNMYGPTETTVWSTCKKITSSQLPILVGQPIDNTHIKILSEEGTELPIGCMGEVCIGGFGVASGYHNRDDLTKMKFVAIGGEMFYKTGDKGRIRSDLELELLGRIDNQIKLRGYRIEPGEIENIINKIEGIVESVVKIHNYSGPDERLIAFLNVNEGFKETKGSILQKLRQELPEYMVPSSFYLETGFPRTPNGKIDRKQLNISTNELGLEKRVIESGDSELSEIEQKIVSIWKKHLKIESVGLNDNYFDIGGTSLTLLEVVKDINKVFEKEIDILNFFEHSTIKSIVALIHSHSGLQIQFNNKQHSNPNFGNLAAKRRNNK
jgi:amino acid adenylation domain-containing protein